MMDIRGNEASSPQMGGGGFFIALTDAVKKVKEKQCRKKRNKERRWNLQGCRRSFPKNELPRRKRTEYQNQKT
jgi:hypothetical protein